MTHPILKNRRAGILLPIFSLPSKEGVGDFKSALDYLEFLSRWGLSYWQILPLNPTDKYLSPYASFSLDAMNLDFINTSMLRSEGYIKEIYRGENRLEKQKFLKENIKFNEIQRKDDFLDFKVKNRSWLNDVVLYRTISDVEGTDDMYLWDKDLLHRQTEKLEEFKNKFGRELEEYFVLEYLARKQWDKVKEMANKKGIRIIGDMPYYPGASSVEIWTNPEYFQLNSELQANCVSGVPADQFDLEGQVWNSPTYNWKVLKEDGFQFHKNKIQRALEKYDYLRLDHFRGYHRYFSIPQNMRAVMGHWEEGPQEEFFQTLKEYKDCLLAEDLGFLDEDFYKFRDRVGIPGMGVLQFEKPGEISSYPRIYYTGNHDTPTLGEFVSSMDSYSRRNWQNFLQEPILKEIILVYALGRSENLCIFQHGDLLDGKNLRINTPGTLIGNWTVQLKEEDFSQSIGLKIKEKLIEGKRINE